MNQRVQLPDGSVEEFPADMTPDEIDRLLRQRFAPEAPAQPSGFSAAGSVGLSAPEPDAAPQVDLATPTTARAPEPVRTEEEAMAELNMLVPEDDEPMPVAKPVVTLTTRNESIPIDDRTADLIEQASERPRVVTQDPSEVIAGADDGETLPEVSKPAHQPRGGPQLPPGAPAAADVDEPAEPENEPLTGGPGRSGLRDRQPVQAPWVDNSGRAQVKRGETLNPSRDPINTILDSVPFAYRAIRNADNHVREGIAGGRIYAANEKSQNLYRDMLDLPDKLHAIDEQIKARQVELAEEFGGSAEQIEMLSRSDQLLQTLKRQRGQVFADYAFRWNMPPEDIEAYNEAQMMFMEMGKRAAQNLDRAREGLIPNEAPEGSFEYYTSAAIGSTAQMLPGLVGSLVARSPAPMMAYIGGYASGQQYVEGRERGLDHDSAEMYMLAGTAAEVLPEWLPMAAILRPGLNAVQRIATGALAEGLQESVTEGLHITKELGFIEDFNITWGEARARMAEAGLIGAGAGTLMGGIVGSYNTVTGALNTTDSASLLDQRIAEGERLARELVNEEASWFEPLDETTEAWLEAEVAKGPLIETPANPEPGRKPRIRINQDGTLVLTEDNRVPQQPETPAEIVEPEVTQEVTEGQEVTQEATPVEPEPAAPAVVPEAEVPSEDGRYTIYPEVVNTTDSQGRTTDETVETGRLLRRDNETGAVWEVNPDPNVQDRLLLEPSTPAETAQAQPAEETPAQPEVTEELAPTVEVSAPREPTPPQPPVAPQPPVSGRTRRVRAAVAQALAPKLEARLKKALPFAPVKLTLDPSVPSQGLFRGMADGTAEIVIGDSLNPENTVRHETVHALRWLDSDRSEFGLFTRQEWTDLESEANRTWISKYDIATQYADAPVEVQVEEAIAAAYGDYQGRAPTSRIKAAFQKIKRFLGVTRETLADEGITRVEDIFESIEQGDIGRRSSGEARPVLPQDPRVDPVSEAEQRQAGPYAPQNRVQTAAPVDPVRPGAVSTASAVSTTDQFVQEAQLNEEFTAAKIEFERAREGVVRDWVSVEEYQAAKQRFIDAANARPGPAPEGVPYIRQQRPLNNAGALETALPITPTGRGGRVTNWDVGEAFTQAHMDHYGRQLDPISNQADFDVMVEALDFEFVEQLKAMDSGLVWYTQDIADAIESTKAIIPELEKTENQDLFLTMAALLSPQQKPLGNWQNATIAMSGFLDTGQIPLEKPNGKNYGVAAQKTGLQLLQLLIDRHGVQGAVNWLRTPKTGAEMAEVRRDSGLFKEKAKLSEYTPNELGLKDVTLGIYMMGPKVGDFMLNSTGIDPNAVTIDLWAARTWARAAGKLLDVSPKKKLAREIKSDVAGKAERENIKSMFRTLAERHGQSPSSVQAVLWFFEQRLFEAHGVSTAQQSFKGAADATVQRPPITRSGDSGSVPLGARAASPDVQPDPDRGGAGSDVGGAAVGGDRRLASGELAPLEGAPTLRGHRGPIQDLVRVAEEYAKGAGIDYAPQAEYVGVDEDRAIRIAEAYEQMEHAPNDPEVKAAYDDLIKQTTAQYQALVDAGYVFTFGDPSDPYFDSPITSMEDLRLNKRMKVFPTEAGFGTDRTFEGNPLDAPTGIEWDGQPVMANDLFRAVHDALGHGLEGAGFRAIGEENAWQAHARLFTGPAVAAITSETRGQNSWLNFGPHGEANRTAAVEETIFADQKTGLMPEWTWTEGRAADMPTETVTERQQRAFHGSREDFDRFRVDKVKNAVNGWGLYFTENKAETRMHTGQDGRTYEVEIPDKSDLMKYETPINQQQPELQALAADLAADPEILDLLPAHQIKALEDGSITGTRLYKMLSSRLGGDQQASMALMERGIQGHYYPDPSAVEDNGMSEFVIYDDQSVAITERFQRLPSQTHQPSRYTYATMQSDNVGWWRRAMNRNKNARSPFERQKGDLFRIKIQDRYLPVTRAVEWAERTMGRDLPGYMNPAKQLTAMPGKVGHDFMLIEQEYAEPIAKIIADSKTLTLSQAGLYMQLKHAAERNAVIGSINEGKPDAGSGWTTEDAEKILAEEFTDPTELKELDAIARIVKRYVDWGIQRRIDAGLITPEQGLAWRTMYQHYVPLKGYAEVDNLNGWDGTGIGKGNVVMGNETQRAKGRQEGSYADNPLIRLHSDLQEMAVRAGKNQIGNALYSLVQQTPQGPWRILEPEQQEVFNSTTGRVELRVMAPTLGGLQSNQFATKVDGKEYRIEILDDRLANSLRNAGDMQMNAVLRTGMAYSKFFSMMNTTLNPQFMITNASRDLQSAAINMQSFGGKDRNALSAAILNPANYANAVQQVWRGLADINDPKAADFKKFSEAGAKVAFWTVSDPNQITPDLQRRVNRRTGVVRRGAGMLDATGGALAQIERANLAIDNAVRLVAFTKARELGWTELDAVDLAKNLTVNFNTRGEFSPTFNALFPFFNAAVQGTAVLARASMGSLRVPAIMVGLIAMGAYFDDWGEELSEVDDDGEKAWNKIQDFDHRRWLYMPWTGDDGEYARVPLAYGYNIPVYAGIQLNRAMSGRKDPNEALVDVLQTTIESTSPVSVGSFLDVTPQIIKPFVEAGVNQNYAGRSIQPRRYDPFDPTPDAYNYYESVPYPYVVLAQQLNNLTGGDIDESGWMDYSPNSIRHVFEAQFGGAYRFLSNSWSSIDTAIFEPEELEARDIPILGQLSRDTGPWLDTGRYYQRMGEVLNAKDKIKIRKEAGEPITQELRDLNSMASQLKSIHKRVKSQRERRTAAYVAYERGEITRRQLREILTDVEEKMAIDVNRFNGMWYRKFGPEAE